MVDNALDAVCLVVTVNLFVGGQDEFLEHLRGHEGGERAASPLVAAEDAVTLDSTNMSEDEVLDRIGELVEQRLASRR